jgi:surface protein
MVTFTNKISWTNFAASQGYLAVVTETFNSYNGSLNNGLTSNAGGIQWTASAAPGGLYARVGLMSTIDPEALLTFTLLPSVQGLAGNFFATDYALNILPAIIGVQLADGLAYVYNTSSLADFIGFYSTGASISSISITVVGNLPPSTNFATVDNLCFVAIAPSTANPTTKMPTTLDPTTSKPTTPAPAECPTLAPVTSQLLCFPPDGIVLKYAVDNYIREGCETTNPTCATRTYFGKIGTWCVKFVTNMNQLFYGESTFNSDISRWDVSSVINMNYMFAGASSFNSNISNWNVSSVINMNFMFNEASSFNSDISKWDVSSVTNMNDMFYAATSFNSDISNWNVGRVTDMNFMFLYALSFNSDISSWNVSSVTSMAGMFQYASSFNSNISSWDVSSVTDMYSMFNSASSFNQNLCPWGPKLSTTFNYDNALYSFIGSGCPNQNKPVGITGPWCAASCSA